MVSFPEILFFLIIPVTSTDEDSLSDPYSEDSDDDPGFVPPVGSSSSTCSTESGEDEEGINTSTIFSSTNENL